ncbi:response regulator transcription factor [Phragmitibacter flavus]|uniref:Response regulator transcription factor n=1 Tax=Phragmitibacter flavus TaxID=2576071 RepID=A0A5R8K9V0_9BACT|nr:LuxR C-terminal-related transcriptional regulator [Phragmitibacter flavus]TLD69047.1 response regulator transcription factor [Phragmitibacter flavus]
MQWSGASCDWAGEHAQRPVVRRVGGRLGIREGTVKLHVTNLLAKFGAPNRTLAAVLAVSKGLVRLGG